MIPVDNFFNVVHLVQKWYALALVHLIYNFPLEYKELRSLLKIRQIPVYALVLL